MGWGKGEVEVFSNKTFLEIYMYIGFSGSGVANGASREVKLVVEQQRNEHAAAPSAPTSLPVSCSMFLFS